MISEEVLIRGGGIAACCCAALLAKAGFKVFMDSPPRHASPVLMLSEQTQLLLRDVFGVDQLFEGAVPITKRVVAWGAREAVALPHAALVISESVLLDRLWASIRVDRAEANHAVHWSVLSSKASLPAVVSHEFGSRTASTCAVSMSSGESCWVESVSSGWLFLIPSGEGRGSLIAVGGDVRALLAESRLISKQNQAVIDSTGSFPAYPRIIAPLCGPGWLTCGTAALAFDPIAGEGAGHALRQGILAAAVIRAMDKAGTDNELFAHYSNRLLGGFLRHLQDCCRFYEAVSGPWWESELEFLKRGVTWAQTELTSHPAGLFRLLGFELHRNA